MKNVTVILLMLSLFAAPCAYGETKKDAEELKREWYADSYMNGRWVLDSVEAGKNARQTAVAYIDGVIDGLYAANPQLMYELYHDYVKEEIVNAVIRYYRVNFTRKNRTVPEVILSGCK